LPSIKIGSGVTGNIKYLEVDLTIYFSELEGFLNTPKPPNRGFV
jgi:hypothetical protein|tara:strand:+ start:496 stop:627 length:132 start_codon:yes stop_codon:yes gene_type:complete